MTDEELAAVVAAIRAAAQQPGETPQPQTSAWKRAARSASIDSASFDELRTARVR